MLVFTGTLSAFTNDFLGQKFDNVSPDVDGGSIAQAVGSGRDGRGGITFVTGNDDNDFSYPLYVQQEIPAAQTQTFGIAVRQTTAQHALGGRLLTLVDGGEDTFGETTQVGINIMPDGTLQAVRANAPDTGVVLRGLDQGGDAQTTLLGTSTTAIDAADTEFVEIQVFHDPAVGSITVNFYDDAGVLKGTWSLTDVNTAVSGRNQSTSFCYGGFCSTDITITARFHEDLQAVISDLYVINGIANPDDSRDPVTFIGNRKPIQLLGTAAGDLSDWTPNPTQANYLNVNEVPPDSGDTENSTATEDAKDTMEMAAAPTGADEAYLAYTAFITSDSAAECVSNDPVNFEAMVNMEQLDPSSVVTAPASGPPCNTTDSGGRRAQTVCTISKNGESVEFKPNADTTGTYYVYLTPQDAPPLLQSATGPGGYGPADFNRGLNMERVSGRASYLLPYWQPWMGFAIATMVPAIGGAGGLTDPGDFFEFKLENVGIGIDVGLMDNLAITAPFNPYSSPIIGFHFREDVSGSPYFYISEQFGYGGEAVIPYSEGDNFRLTRNDPNIVLTQNGFTVGTFTPGAMPTIINPYVFAGRWGWDSVFETRTLRPGIKDAFYQITGSDCIAIHYVYDQVVPGTWPGITSWNEYLQWGVEFDEGGDALILDPNNPGVPDNPIFGYNTNTRLVFSLEGGNVVLRIHDWINYLDNITNESGVGVYTYSRPFADTDDFVLGDVWSVGVPNFPFPSLEYDYVNGVPSMPLRLAVLVAEDSVFALPAKAGVKEVSFTFVSDTDAGPMPFAGVMRQAGNNRTGTAVLAPTGGYRYKQSMLASTPQDEAITADLFNASQHGYNRDPE